MCRCYLKVDPIPIFSDKFYPFIIAPHSPFSPAIATRVQPPITLWWDWSRSVTEFPATAYPGSIKIAPAITLSPVSFAMSLGRHFAQIKAFSGIINLISLWELACHWRYRWEPVFRILTQRCSYPKRVDSNKQTRCNYAGGDKMNEARHCRLAYTLL